MNQGTNNLERVSCILCGSRRTRTVWPANIGADGLAAAEEEFDYSYASVTVGVKRHHRIVRCPGCGLLYVSPRPTQLGGAQIYERLRDERYASLREERVEHFAGELVRLERHSPRGPVLDIGCGSGYFLEAARRRGWGPVIGVELNSWMADLGRREAGLEIFTRQLRQCRFPGKSFQLASFWDVLEHTNDPLAELREVHRLLRPGGMLALLVPNADSFWARTLGERWWAVIRMHLFYFTPATITRLLERAGFRVELMTSYPKEARLAYLTNLLRDHPRLKRGADTALRLSGMGGRVLKLDPRDQMKIYARRVP